MIVLLLGISRGTFGETTGRFIPPSIENNLWNPPIIGARNGRMVNAVSYTFALAERKLGTGDNTQGAASLCPELRAGYSLEVRQIAPLACNKPPE